MLETKAFYEHITVFRERGGLVGEELPQFVVPSPFVAAGLSMRVFRVPFL